MSRYSPISHPLLRSARNFIMAQDEWSEDQFFLKWYDVDSRRINPEIYSKFHHHYCDEETKDFINYSKNISYAKHVFDGFMTVFLYPFFGSTSRNGILNRGTMFVASKSLFHLLINFCHQKSTLLDIGAGDGNVTQCMSGIFNEVYATECSIPMKNKLESRGYTVLDINGWKDKEFDVISCLNVLDRCEAPLQLLQDIYNSLKKKGGLLVLALVLPYHGSVEYANEWKPQRQPLPIQGCCLELQLNSLVKDVLTPLGFRLNMVTKVPYLCSGDLNASYYSLSDVLLSLTVDCEIND